MASVRHGEHKFVLFVVASDDYLLDVMILYDVFQVFEAAQERKRAIRRFTLALSGKTN